MSDEGCAMSIRNNRRRIVAMAGLGAGILAASNVVCAQIPCSYDVQIIASPLDCGLGTVNTYGLGLNEHGDVVGYYQCPLWNHTEAFLWTAEEGFVTLVRPAGVTSAIAVDINEAGIICGTVFVSGLDNRGFVYENGKWTILPPVVDVPGPRCGAAAINNAGTVVGQRSITENLNPQNAYIWSAEEGFTDLGVMNGPKSAARDVNEKGDVCGWTGVFLSSDEVFVWSDGKLRFLGPIPGGESSTGSAINALGQVSGAGLIESKDSPTIVTGFVWDDGVFSLIDPIIGYDTSSSGDINDQGYATGTSVNLDQPTDRHAFVWINGVTNDLNDFIDPKLPLVVGGAAGIANSGQIVANGHDDAGETLSFLLTPRNSPLGDLDSDCIVGVSDLLILLAEWGQCDSPADLNGDGIVGVKDLLILLGNWGSN